MNSLPYLTVVAIRNFFDNEPLWVSEKYSFEKNLLLKQLKKSLENTQIEMYESSGNIYFIWEREYTTIHSNTNRWGKRVNIIFAGAWDCVKHFKENIDKL